MGKMTRRDFVPLLGTAIAGGALLSFSKSSERYFVRPIKYKTPKRLAAGDTIGLCAPAGAVKSEEEIKEFEAILRRLGFKTKRAKNISNRYGYLGGTDAERAEDFMSLIEDEDVNAIFFVRGGWGCARLLPLIDFNAIRENPKIIMGFSDITTLLLAITEKSRMITFHGPSGNSTWNNYSVDYIKNLLMEGMTFTYSNKASDAPIKTYTSGKAYGELFGGNLTVLTSLLGSSYLPPWGGKILFLEDVKEEPYSIDRMLMQLKLNGVFENVKGVILGNFRKCVAEEPERSFTLEEVFEQYFKNLDIPVFYGAQVGHTLNKFTLPVGAEVMMDADEGTIQLMRSAVH